MVVVRDINVAFAGVRALTGVSFQIDAGKIHAVIGPNGAGKTTLFNCISGLLRPDNGSIQYAGTDLVRSPAHKRVRLGIARTFQSLALCKNLSVLDNVLLGTYHHHAASGFSYGLQLPWARRAESAARRDAVELLELVGCRDVSEAKVQELPYGVLKRVEYARALACRPRLLLLDEPCAGLNDSERVDLMRLIRWTRERDVTILLVEHDMNLVMSIADQVTVLNFGKVIADGPPAQVQVDPEVIAAYLGVEEAEDVAQG